MPKQLLFVYNPASGHGTIGQKLDGIIDVFSSRGYDVIVHPSKNGNDVYKTIQVYAHDVERIVVAGGDGTVNDAFSALAGIEDAAPLGIIPSGSTNDFANSIGISKNPIEAAVDIMAGTEMLIDAGLFNGREYTYIAGFGLFTDIAYSTSQTAKNMFGYFAYLWEAGRELFNAPVFKVRFTVDDYTGEDVFIYGMVTNSMSVAGVKYLPGRNIIMDDGLFEVTLVRNPKNPLELAETMVCLMSGEPTPQIIRRKTDSIVFESDEPVPWTLDGEDGGEHKRVEIKTLKQKIRIIIPGHPDNMKGNQPELVADKNEKEGEDEYN